MRKCGYCGRENRDVSTHCTECGTELADSPPAPIARPHPPGRRWRLPGLGYGTLILAVVIVYFLSYGPVIRFTGKTISKVRTATGLIHTYTVTVQYPHWVGLAYFPAFWLSATEWGNRTYGAYLRWWENQREN